MPTSRATNAITRILNAGPRGIPDYLLSVDPIRLGDAIRRANRGATLIQIERAQVGRRGAWGYRAVEREAVIVAATLALENAS